MNGKNSTLKIPLFTPFESIQQGMDFLIQEIEKCSDKSAKYNLAIIYGCLGSTLEKYHHLGKEITSHNGHIPEGEK